MLLEGLHITANSGNKICTETQGFSESEQKGGRSQPEPQFCMQKKFPDKVVERSARNLGVVDVTVKLFHATRGISEQ